MLGRTTSAHFIGVGGSGMSPLAEILLRCGLTVTGSDLRPSPVTDRLRELGLVFYEGHDARHLGSVDVVVRSSAVRGDNPEVLEAVRRGVPVIARGDLLAELMRPLDGVAVAGAHGKTTTTAMVAMILALAGLDPTVVIGGKLPSFGGGARVGGGRLLVAEADESDRSFLRLSPVVAVITNVDEEHLERYADLADLQHAFETFAGRVPFYGAAVLCTDDPFVRQLATRLSSPVTTYGLEDPAADFGAVEVTPVGFGTRAAVVRRCGRDAVEPLGTFSLQVPGRHNVSNALGAIAVADWLGVGFDTSARALEAFTGTERRFERRGEAGGITVIDDYGHHPTEIAAVIEAARDTGASRVVCVFQPHRYTRTARLIDEFGPALALADAVVLTDIYSAGEDPLPGVTLEALAARVRTAVAEVHVVAALDDVPAVVARVARPGDLVITLGAGSIGAIGSRVLEALAECL